MAIGGEDQNEDEDLDVVVVEDQNVQDQNQAMEQDLDDQYLADEVQKAKLKRIKFRQITLVSFIVSNRKQRKDRRIIYSK
ncbi:unnamed protein product [Oikopleura dioica]|uniref:Uncharacterized protein n=1 Tax=Oikopleura dioica TaxID=34765 RepID=E4X1T8_OIKDI|nr:unnamed protein product [Oikopleura dioica]